MEDPQESEDELFAKFEKDGEAKVAGDLAHKRYSPAKLRSAAMWLGMQKGYRAAEEQEYQEHLHLDEIDIARSAKNATWVSAGVSALALIISLIALWVSLTRS